jgi:excisionase family DNA binding protein
MNQTSRQRYLLGSEVAELLHVSPKTVARWAKEGKLPCMRTLGGHRRYPEREILELRDKLIPHPTTREQPSRVVIRHSGVEGSGLNAGPCPGTISEAIASTRCLPARSSSRSGA